VAGRPRVTWLGHATVLLELGRTRLLTDPVLRSRVVHLRRHGAPPEPPERVDAVLLSHLHYDHTDLPSLRLLGRDIRVLAPRGSGAWLRRVGFPNAEELAAGERADVGGVEVTAVPARHDDRRRPGGGPRADPIGFVVAGSRRIYFAGDTDLFDGMARLAPLDAALLPIAGWGPKLGSGHLDAERAAQAAATIRPRLVVPIHWGTLRPRWVRARAWFSDPPYDFQAAVARLAPEIEAHVIGPGESLGLPA
jgi:L-ascorbate metabolism protein UlaG (beta-lactamase superfamily)